MGENRDSCWETQPTVQVLKDNEVHVWLAMLYQLQHKIDDFWTSLSDDERKRADKFRFLKHRLQFVVARGILRYTLGAYLKVPPNYLCFKYNDYGKPSLGEEFCSNALKFNISHSGMIVLLAFTNGREVGVDVEEIRLDFATEEIAERFFSAHEVSVWRCLPRELQAEAFFQCWVQKEAFIKAIGNGLSCPLDMFDVTLTPDEPARLLATRVKGYPASNWSITGLGSMQGYKAAIAVEGSDWRVKYWRYSSGL